MQDPMLEMMTRGIYREAQPAGPSEVTLTVGGTIVCGRCCSFEEFLDGWTGGRGRELLGKLHQIADEDEPPGDGTSEDENPMDKETSPLRYIHLCEAQYLVGGQLVPQDVKESFWRGRLDRVDGWALGRLRSVPAS